MEDTTPMNVLLIRFDFPVYSIENNSHETGNPTIPMYAIFSQNNLFGNVRLPRFKKSANAHTKANPIQNAKFQLPGERALRRIINMMATETNKLRNNGI